MKLYQLNGILQDKLSHRFKEAEGGVWADFIVSLSCDKITKFLFKYDFSVLENVDVFYPFYE